MTYRLDASRLKIMNKGIKRIKKESVNTDYFGPTQFELKP